MQHKIRPFSRWCDIKWGPSQGGRMQNRPLSRWWDAKHPPCKVMGRRERKVCDSWSCDQWFEIQPKLNLYNETMQGTEVTRWGATEMRARKLFNKPASEMGTSMPMAKNLQDSRSMLQQLCQTSLSILLLLNCLSLPKILLLSIQISFLIHLCYLEIAAGLTKIQCRKPTSYIEHIKIWRFSFLKMFTRNFDQL